MAKAPTWPLGTTDIRKRAPTERKAMAHLLGMEEEIRSVRFWEFFTSLTLYIQATSSTLMLPASLS